MIVQWLAQTTGKSVVKHPRVQCQLTIVSSKKVSTREAINLIYRALALEGFTAVESSNAILLVPEGQEPRMSPVLLGASQDEIPEGRQKLVKIFPLTHIQAADLRERIRGVLSDKAAVETDDRANQLIVTDYNDNLRLLVELIKDLDASSSYLTVETYPIKHGDAEEVGNLLNLILNSQSGAPVRRHGRRLLPLALRHPAVLRRPAVPRLWGDRRPLPPLLRLPAAEPLPLQDHKSAFGPTNQPIGSSSPRPNRRCPRSSGFWRFSTARGHRTWPCG